MIDLVMTQRYMNAIEVARYLGCTETAVRQRVKRRDIPFIKDGSRIRFDKNDIDRYLARRKVDKQDEP